MRTAEEANATSELARASRLERMANDLLIEAREIRALHGSRRTRKRVDLMQLVKAQGDRR